MAFQNMVNMQLMMFLLVAVGFLVRKKNIIGETGRKDMVNFCLYVTLPFNIFHSFQMEWEWSMLKSFAQVLFLATGYCILSIIMSCIFYRKAEPDKRKPLRYGTIVSNGGFLGNPVIEGIYGTNGLFYASVFMLPVRIVMWSVGTSCFMKEKSESLVKKGADTSMYCGHLSGTFRHDRRNVLPGKCGKIRFQGSAAVIHPSV